MPSKQKAKYLVDFGMTVLLPLLMAYTLVGEATHEWLGMAMLVLFILHHGIKHGNASQFTKNSRYSWKILLTDCNYRKL